MTRKRVTASEKKQRHEWVIRQINACMGLSEITAFTAETWGVSRRAVRDVVAKDPQRLVRGVQSPRHQPMGSVVPMSREA